MYLPGLIWMALLFAACSPPQVTQGLITVAVLADEKSYQVQVQAGSTVQEALATAGIVPGELDRSEPPLFTVLTDGAEVHLIRVREEYYIEQVVIPFEHQELRNEALPVGERLLSQPGVNGLQEITYRRVFEDGVEVQNSVIKTETIQDAIPEIVMVGSQTPYATLAIPGRLVYLAAGNAWLVEGTTSNRRAVITTNDLDGRIFSLSPDGEWLLFTRASDDNDTINQLWAVRLDDDPGQLIDLGVSNVIHFADWGAELNVVGYSTVEPRSTAPGWQANNDLVIIGVSPSGVSAAERVEIEANSGGVYGWWGMDFRWANDGVRLAYARPDSIGIYDTRLDALEPLVTITPLQTGGDWAWVPGISWAPDGNSIYTVTYLPGEGATGSDNPPGFDLLAIPLGGGSPVHLVTDVGMFAYPQPSPMSSTVIGEPITSGGMPLVENSYRVAYLQALNPAQSDTSLYRLFVMDRDGSNRAALFPTEGAPGLDPQQVVWSPTYVDSFNQYAIGVLYQGNIWFVDANNGQAQQITGDGLVVRIDWR